MTTSGLTITRYQRQNQREVLELVYSQFHVHTHLDWHGVEAWLSSQSMPILLAWHERRLHGVLGVSEPLNGTSWLRLLAVRDNVPVTPTFKALWDIMHDVLRPLGVRSLWTLIASEWLQHYISLIGAHHAETIVTLRRTSKSLPPLRNPAVHIRPAEDDDLAEMVRIDHAAFNPPWQLAQADLWQAYRVAANATVALLDGQIVGYQLTTRHRDSGHLARLAVEPLMHGGGVGGALLHHLLRTFSERDIHLMTVNTQASNLRSQRLYTYYHFLRNGYDMPVWQAEL